jgi:hypothetical protein
MTKLSVLLFATLSLSACAEEKAAITQDDDRDGNQVGTRAGAGGSSGAAGRGGSGGTAGGTAAGSSGRNQSGGSNEPHGGAGESEAGAPGNDAGGVPMSGGSAGSAPAAGTGGTGNVCQGGEVCVNYVVPCQPAACTNGHVPFCYCGGGEEPVVECHEGGETC